MMTSDFPLETTKPSGTTSILKGVSPGFHHPIVKSAPVEETFDSLTNELIEQTFKARVHIVPKYAQEDEPFMPHHYNQLLRVLIEIRDELENIADRP